MTDNDDPQVAALRAYVERREHADHDTFSCGREFAEALLATIDGTDERQAWTSRYVIALEAEILEREPQAAIDRAVRRANGEDVPDV